MVNPLPLKSDKSPPWLEATLAKYLVQMILRNKYQLRDSVQFSGVFIFPDLNAQDRKRRNLLRQKLKAVTVTQPFTRFFTRHCKIVKFTLKLIPSQEMLSSTGRNAI
ncbi:hypothetical protein GJ496_001589 [Pomphorhynchus laevis]|nr:hypothetical protein GJ496_001589 [Pomphorhynchus laevis]